MLRCKISLSDPYTELMLDDLALPGLEPMSGSTQESLGFVQIHRLCTGVSEPLSAADVRCELSGSLSDSGDNVSGRRGRVEMSCVHAAFMMIQIASAVLSRVYASCDQRGKGTCTWRGRAQRVNIACKDARSSAYGSDVLAKCG